MAIRECDIPTVEGRVYHLDIAPGQIASDIILVGDPGRAAALAQSFFSSLEVNHEHRGLRTVTGESREGCRRMSIVTSGMGTPSLEIVLNEIVFLLEFDLAKREQRCAAPPRPVNLIRLGTSGALCADTPIGIPVISSHAVGLDNSGIFWQVECREEFVRQLEKEVQAALEQHAVAKCRFAGQFSVYASKADPAVVAALEQAARALNLKTITGITASAPGFFAAQGKDFLRVRSSIPNLDFILGDLRADRPPRIENMEMETSFLFHFAQGVGYRAGSICVPIDNRRHDLFDSDYAEHVDAAAKIAFRALEELPAS